MDSRLLCMHRRVSDLNGEKQDSVEIEQWRDFPESVGNRCRGGAEFNRGYWAIEAAHNILEILHVFDEDTSVIRSGYGPREHGLLAAVRTQRAEKNRNAIGNQSPNSRSGYASTQERYSISSS